MAEDQTSGDMSYEGCYGSKVSYADVREFLADSFTATREAEASGSEERFATCVWGHSGIGKTALIKQH